VKRAKPQLKAYPANSQHAINHNNLMKRNSTGTIFGKKGDEELARFHEGYEDVKEKGGIDPIFA
jgi:hypothetical protein